MSYGKDLISVLISYCIYGFCRVLSIGKYLEKVLALISHPSEIPDDNVPLFKIDSQAENLVYPLLAHQFVSRRRKMMAPMDDLDKSGRSSRASSIMSSSSGKSEKKKDSTVGFSARLKRFDLYTKLEEDYKVQTSGGATLSIVGWVVMTILIIGEFNNYMTPTMKEHMVVDTTLGQRLRVNLNITFHALTCADVHLDAMDVAGRDVMSVAAFR